MDFQTKLLDVAKALSRDEVKALTFLCTDLLGKNPNMVESVSDLFSRLADQDRLSPEQPQLLTELLLIIQRRRLVRELNLCDLHSSTISPYRKLLYDLSEEITNDTLRDMKFLLNKDLSRRKLEENVTTLEVFLEMEQKDLINDTDLTSLETIFKSVCPMLNEHINRYKATLEPRPGIIAQEVGRARSQSCSSKRPKISQCERGSSLDVPNELNPPLSNRGTENKSTISLVKSDALEIPPHELKAPPDEQPPLTTTNTNSEGVGTYPMTRSKRGVCVIINNHNFSHSTVPLKVREGTMVDEKSLKDVFEWLGFEVQIHRDTDKQRMVSALWELGMADHSEMDCVVCCVLSHGLEGGVYGVDGNVVKIRELTEPFNGKNCPTLIGKPKLLFIQACQGNNSQRAVNIEEDSRVFDPHISDFTAAKESIPSGADYLLGMATVPSFVSFRQRDKGTWYIQSLCQNLIDLVPRGEDLVTILTKVNADVSQKIVHDGQKKQMPQPAFSLRKKVVFPIPQTPPPSLLH
ncbi:caspase-8 isoform X2 [Mugil cephalus]|uniref:caspase-8 isoform X2 n=1 Tax=Mugil cephalus TaxID=48193 RepID=UPI001FB79333|nr:caspase-8 isoform X2 [Mugil cephalus]